MPAVRTFEELRHGLVAGPRLLLVVRHLRRLALAAGVHRLRIINPDGLVHAVPILPLPVERPRVVLVFRHFTSLFLFFCLLPSFGGGVALRSVGLFPTS